MPRKALITGITGQDGSYLAELLLEKGYRVSGVVRRSSTPNVSRIEHLLERVELWPADLLDPVSLIEVLEGTEPDEVYNLAAQSFVPTSWRQPLLTHQITALGVARLLEAIVLVNPKIKFYQASSSEMFGVAAASPQTETTPFNPQSPYAAAKVYGHFTTSNFRKRHGLFACSGILFNHESPRRGREFVTRKITHGLARIKRGLTRELRLGNPEAARDWGYAGDYVKAMWLMMQRPEPSDYVVGTGTARTVRDFARLAFELAGLDWREHVTVDRSLFRRAEVDCLLADPSRAQAELGWSPEVGFERLVRMMVEADLESMTRAEVSRGGVGQGLAGGSL